MNINIPLNIDNFLIIHIFFIKINWKYIKKFIFKIVNIMNYNFVLFKKKQNWFKKREMGKKVKVRLRRDCSGNLLELTKRLKKSVRSLWTLKKISTRVGQPLLSSHPIQRWLWHAFPSAFKSCAYLTFP